MKKILLILSSGAVLLIFGVLFFKAQERADGLSPKKADAPASVLNRPSPPSRFRTLATVSAWNPRTAAITKTLAPTPVPSPQRGMLRIFSGQPGDPYRNAELLKSEEGRVDDEGRFVRLRLFRTALKFPLIRVEDHVLKGREGGEEQILSRNAAVADHAVLKLEPGYASKDLERLASSLGFSVRKVAPGGHYYLVSFPANEVHSLEDAMERLRKSNMVAVAEPDFLVRAAF